MATREAGRRRIGGKGVAAIAGLLVLAFLLVVVVSTGLQTSQTAANPERVIAAQGTTARTAAKQSDLDAQLATP